MAGTTRLAITVHNMKYNNIIHVAASCTCNINQCVYHATQVYVSYWQRLHTVELTTDRPTNSPHHCCSLARSHTRTHFFLIVCDPITNFIKLSHPFDCST
jgi:hypothetical protein